LPQVTLINTQAEWDRAAARLAQEPELALDTESNSLYTYRESICLIQIAAGEQVFLLDPLAVPDLSALGRILADSTVVKVLHGSDYDIRSFDRDYGFNIASLFDTETAARFLGQTSPNLASVLETFLGVVIPKSRKLQRSNWALRPLSVEALDYAGNDVRHLSQLAQRLRHKLGQLDRQFWVQEEFQRLERARFGPSRSPDEALFRVKGSEHLRPRELAVFKQLFIWREGEAKRLDRPPFQVVGNDTLLTLAQSSADGGSRTRDVLGMFSRMPRRFQEGMRVAISRGLAGPEMQRPGLPRRESPWTGPGRERLQRLKGWRTGRGASLSLDPPLLWPAVSLERLALNPEDWRAELLDGESGNGAQQGTHEVRAWQRREFGSELQELVCPS
jgi:ribonuclease D